MRDTYKLPERVVCLQQTCFPPASRRDLCGVLVCPRVLCLSPPSSSRRSVITRRRRRGGHSPSRQPQCKVSVRLESQRNVLSMTSDKGLIGAISHTFRLEGRWKPVHHTNESHEQVPNITVKTQHPSWTFRCAVCPFGRGSGPE